MLAFIIKYWIEILFSLVITIVTHLYRQVVKYIKRENHRRQDLWHSHYE